MNSHLSFSQRRIMQLEAELTVMKQMQVEYNCFLNYVVIQHGEIFDSNGELIPLYNQTPLTYLSTEKVFKLLSAEMKQIPILPIKTEIVDNGAILEIRRVNPNLNHNTGPKIIVPS